jgi:hypothetical protein
MYVRKSCPRGIANVSQQNDNGMNVTLAEGVDYFKFLAATASTNQLQIGLKNSQLLLPEVQNLVSFAVNENCIQYSECGLYTPLLKAGKPVFHIEYPSKTKSVSAWERNTFCKGSGPVGMSTVLKGGLLDGWVQYCDGSTAKTTLQ